MGLGGSIAGGGVRNQWCIKVCIPVRMDVRILVDLRPAGSDYDRWVPIPDENRAIIQVDLHHGERSQAVP